MRPGSGTGDGLTEVHGGLLFLLVLFGHGSVILAHPGTAGLPLLESFVVSVCSPHPGWSPIPPSRSGEVGGGAVAPHSRCSTIRTAAQP